jgi:hypothetical protein
MTAWQSLRVPNTQAPVNRNDVPSKLILGNGSLMGVGTAIGSVATSYITANGIGKLLALTIKQKRIRGLRGWITDAIKPTVLNKVIKTESRGAFSLDEYQAIYTGS